MIQTGSIVSDIRGSVGDETYSRNQGGLYVKSRSGPTAEPNANRLVITAAMTALSQAWSGTLTDAQRATWRTYAKQYPKANRWGQRTLHNGYNRFVAVNFAKYVQSSAIAFASAPIAPPFNPPDFTFAATTAPDTFTITAPLLNEPNTDHPLWIFTYVGAEQNVGVNFYAHPFTSLSYDVRTLAAWQAAALVVTSDPPAFTTGKKIWLRMRVQCSISGNISTPAQASTIFDA